MSGREKNGETADGEGNQEGVHRTILAESFRKADGKQKVKIAGDRGIFPAVFTWIFLGRV